MASCKLFWPVHQDRCTPTGPGPSAPRRPPGDRSLTVECRCPTWSWRSGYIFNPQLKVDKGCTMYSEEIISCLANWCRHLHFYQKIYVLKKLLGPNNSRGRMVKTRARRFGQLLEPDPMVQSVRNRFQWGIGLRNRFSACIVKFWSLEGVQRRELARPPHLL
jgi:hypothetical protein